MQAPLNSDVRKNCSDFSLCDNNRGLRFSVCIASVVHTFLFFGGTFEWVCKNSKKQLHVTWFGIWKNWYPNPQKRMVLSRRICARLAKPQKTIFALHWLPQPSTQVTIVPFAPKPKRRQDYADAYKKIPFKIFLSAAIASMRLWNTIRNQSMI